MKQLLEAFDKVKKDIAMLYDMYGSKTSEVRDSDNITLRSRTINV